MRSIEPTASGLLDMALDQDRMALLRLAGEPSWDGRAARGNEVGAAPMELATGLEPTTTGLQNRSSTS